MWIYTCIGIFIGIILGLTGAGGGMLAVPALVSSLGLSIQQASPIALIAVAGGSIIGAAQGLHQGLVRYKAAILMVLIGIPFSSIGISVSKILPQRILFMLFALIMICVSIRLLITLYKNSDALRTKLILGHVNPSNGKFYWTWSTGFFLGSIGALAGFTSGLLGIGGGFIIVPLLRRFTNVSMHAITATSLLVISLVSIAGVINALSHGIVIPIKITILFSIATIIGMLIGRKASMYISQTYIQFGFALILILNGIMMLVKNI